MICRFPRKRITSRERARERDGETQTNMEIIQRRDAANDGVSMSDGVHCRTQCSLYRLNKDF